MLHNRIKQTFLDLAALEQIELMAVKRTRGLQIYRAAMETTNTISRGRHKFGLPRFLFTPTGNKKEEQGLMNKRWEPQNS